MHRTRLWWGACLALTHFLSLGRANDQTVLEYTHQPPKSIAIVGAGSAGLAVLKTLLDLPLEVRQGWEIVLYEQRRSVGGVWLPDPNEPVPPDLPETPLYPELKTNTPNPSMTYPQFPFRQMTPLFPSHDYVWQYHLDYAAHFGLLRYVSFNTSVTSASWHGNAERGKWNITVHNQHTDSRSYHLFDHLVVANGHNHYPYIPTWPGQDAWLNAETTDGPQREILHSIFWRNGTKYEGRTVLVIGGGASGRDAALHTAPFARKLFLSLKEDKQPRRLPVNYILKPEISHFTPESVVFVDGTSSSEIDSLILGTGYELRIPFLSAGGTLEIDPSARSCPLDPPNLTTNLRYLFPLHEHVFSLAGAYPATALSFVGLPILVANCPSDIAQALLVVHGIARPEILPSRSDMLAELRKKEQHMVDRGLDPYNVGHRLVDIDEGDGQMPDMAHDYQDAIVEFLKEKGVIPDDGKPFVEDWRRKIRNDSEYLWRAWERVEEEGEESVRRWLKGVKAEDEWVELMQKLVDWEKAKEKN